MNLAFNKVDPILLIGDSHGGVTLAKLSPNLHKFGPDLSKWADDPKKIPADLQNVSINDWERKKMDDLLIVQGKWEKDY